MMNGNHVKKTLELHILDSVANVVKLLMMKELILCIVNVVITDSFYGKKNTVAHIGNISITIKNFV